MFMRLWERIKTIRKDLNRSIYVGERLESNMKALTFVSIVSASIGGILFFVDLFSHQPLMTILSLVAFVLGSACAFCTRVLKNRELAIKIPLLFSMFVCTFYLLTGFGKGSAILWSLMLPIGVCYFVSVKYGILLSAYYTVLYAVIFYTPLNAIISEYYTVEFIQRFPLLYAGLSLFTGMAMIQYHRTALFEIEHANSLTEEVERQTTVVREQSRKIEQMSFQTIQTLANAIDAKDPYTKGHSTRVSLYSVRIAEALGWDSERINNLKFAALLHDIGKIGVPDAILNNPRRLSDIEFDIIKSHTTMGREILKDKIMIQMAEDVAGSHHERYDGTGYPQGLKGTEISEESRIAAIADSFDAMSSDRVYRKACEKDHIRSELLKGKGTQFDPAFVDVFLGLWERGELEDIIHMEVSGKKPEAEEGIGASSVLLQEVVESFVAQSAKDDIDITTGILSRNSGEAAIAQAMKQEKGCLVFFDVDNLKKINDTYGHEAGDRILHIMGDTLTDNSTDAVCCRLGGDEFLFFLKSATKKEAESLVVRIFTRFDERKHNDPEVAMASLSAGMVMCTPDDPYTDAYNKADKALYHVKQNGKGSYGFYNDASEKEADDELDVGRLVNSIKNSGSYKGAMSVEYREFAKLYEYVSNLEQRFSHAFKLLIITLEPVSSEGFNVDELERAMYGMEQSIRQTIRDVDVLTRYGSRQYLVILLGTDDKGVRTAVDRIFRGYYKMSGSRSFEPSYSVADLKELAETQSG